jgi:hypothetical protein
LRSFAFNILMNSKASASTLSQDHYRAALARLKHLLKIIAISKHLAALYCDPFRFTALTAAC